MLKKRTVPVIVLALLSIAVLVAVGKNSGPQALAEPGRTIGAPQGDGPGYSQIPLAPPLPAAAGTVTFSEDFDNQKDKTLPTGWTVLPEFPGMWVSYHGRLEQWGDEDKQPISDPTLLVATNTSLSDGVYETQVYPMSGDAVGVVFRGSDSGYYLLSLYANMPNNSPKAYLFRVAADGKRTAVAVNRSWKGLDFTLWQRIEVRTAGDQITVSVGNTQLIEVRDSGPAIGWVGVWSIADRGSAFDNVRVTSGGSKK